MLKLLQTTTLTAGLVFASFGAAFAEDVVERTEISRTAVSGVEGMEMVISRLVLKPGQRIPMHTHPGDENSVVIVGGKVQLPNGKEVVFAENTPLFFPKGQVHGGLGQGIGQALMENTRYDENGQLLSASYMDYAMPRAADMPAMDCGFEAIPTRINPMGVKGVGEAGSVGALAAGMSAVTDALAELGVETFAMPAAPGRVWSAIRAARRPE